ncbi:MAG: acyl-CoA dehydrogenase [Alphaproteobacteria bacterium]|jgi:3-sulfinopropanoyl-CoA desulfinase|nr:acyl-CoA dehydrogenase [Alphaproteobacteria bacterium]
MLDFTLTDDQKELIARARTFARDVVAPEVRHMDETNEYPRSVVDGMAKEDFMGLTLPTAYGGGGRPLIDALLVVEELAKVCGTVARICVDANTAVQKAIVENGTEAQKKRYLPPIVAGDKPAIAITEPEAGSAATDLTTRAEPAEGGFTLNGEKRWITGAGETDLYLVFARFGDVPGSAGIGALLVPADTPGLSVPKVRQMMGVRGMPEGDVVFDNCYVPAENILLPAGAGFKKLMGAYNLQRLGAATVALGIAQGAFDLAASYALEREQFGQPIGEFQGIQWMLSDMYQQLECSRLLIHRAAVNAGTGLPDKTEAAVAKVQAAEMAISVTNTALQIHGAAGYSRELPLERMVRDARMFTIGGGTAQVQRNLIGKEILKNAQRQRHID